MTKKQLTYRATNKQREQAEREVHKIFEQKRISLNLPSESYFHTDVYSQNPEWVHLNKQYDSARSNLEILAAKKRNLENQMLEEVRSKIDEARNVLTEMREKKEDFITQIAFAKTIDRLMEILEEAKK